MKLSSRFHLATGLSSLVVTLVLAATYLGLVPDRDTAVRAGRIALSEAMAVTASTIIEDGTTLETEPEALAKRLGDTLGFVAKRNPAMLSVGVRSVDGRLVASVGEHAGAWKPLRGNLSTDTEVSVPLLQGREQWGSVELRFMPVDPIAWLPAQITPQMRLMAFLAVGCFAAFYLYLRRMLRHLDPSSAIPGRVRNAFDALAEGLLVLDPKGQIVLANQAFAAHVETSSDDLIGRSAASFDWTDATDSPVHADDLPWTASLRDAQARHGVVMVINTPVQSDAGSPIEAQEAGTEVTRRTLLVNCSPVPGAGGKPAGVLVSFDDVTELEEKEAELREARDEADAANQAKSDFLANMSHEIRTPMNAILGFTELLRRGWNKDAKDADRYLATIHSSGKHLLELINDILDLSKVEAGRMEVERLPVAAHRVIQEVVRIMAVKADEKGVFLKVDFGEGLPAHIETDPSRLRQIVTNLVGNALKFTDHGGVTVSARIETHGVAPRFVMDVSDTGIGIPLDKCEAVFEPFVQAETSTTRKFGGTGLGLAISRGFARALGGDIKASSVVGQGSVFSVMLDPGDLSNVPWLAAAQLGESDAAVSEIDEGHWVFPATARVLVVDDGPENRELVRLVLEEAGVMVVEAENGQAGLDLVTSERFDLVLMDLQMPVMDGFTATRAMRDAGVQLPVLALTANAMKGYETQIEAAGFSGHLTKPVDIDAMLEEVARRLGGVRELRHESPQEPRQEPRRELRTAPRQAPVEAPTTADKETTQSPVEQARAAMPVPAFTDTAPSTLPVMTHPSLPSPHADAAPALDAIHSRLADHPRLRKVVRSFALQLP
ncbi:MAG: arcB 7 [Rhizobacter sp.]|nr:arcB 7 [Rhizobacter sp.]